MKHILVGAALLLALAACQAPATQNTSGRAPMLSGPREQEVKARAIELAEKATTLYDMNAKTAADAGSDHSNLAEIRGQVAREHGSFSDGRWIARQLEGDTWQVIYGYKINNIDYSYRFIVNVKTGKVIPS
jgi:hypothetical protein